MLIPASGSSPANSTTLFRMGAHQFGLPGREKAEEAVRWKAAKLSEIIEAERSTTRTRSKTKALPISARSRQSSMNSMVADGKEDRKTHSFMCA